MVVEYAESLFGHEFPLSDFEAVDMSAHDFGELDPTCHVPDCGRRLAWAERKRQQIAYMVEQLRELLAKRRRGGCSARHLLDVGGGRGDLAVCVAQALEDVHVTVVDINSTSLQAWLGERVSCT